MVYGAAFDLWYSWKFFWFCWCRRCTWSFLSQSFAWYFNEVWLILHAPQTRQSLNLMNQKIIDFKTLASRPFLGSFGAYVFEQRWGYSRAGHSQQIASCTQFSLLFNWKVDCFSHQKLRVFSIDLRSWKYVSGFLGSPIL